MLKLLPTSLVRQQVIERRNTLRIYTKCSEVYDKNGTSKGIYFVFYLKGMALGAKNAFDGNAFIPGSRSQLSYAHSYKLLQDHFANS